MPRDIEVHSGQSMPTVNNRPESETRVEARLTRRSTSNLLATFSNPPAGQSEPRLRSPIPSPKAHTGESLNIQYSQDNENSTSEGSNPLLLTEADPDQQIAHQQ